MRKSKLQTRTASTAWVLEFPLLLSLIPALVSDSIFSYRIAGLPTGYCIMFVLTSLILLKNKSHQININKYVILILSTCLLVVLPFHVTIKPVAHLLSSILIVFNLYFFWASFNLGSKVEYLFQPYFFKRAWRIILLCLLSYFFIEQIFKSTSFPNIFPFFFYRSAQGSFLIALLSIAIFEVVQGRRSQSVKLTIFLLIIAIIILGSRTTFISAFLLISFSFLNSTRGFKIFLLFISFLLLFSYLIPDFIDRIQRISEVSRLITLDLNAAKSDGASLYRIIFWTGSFEIIKQHWLSGIGFSVADINYNFPIDLLELKEFVPRPHNTFLSIFMGGGLLGGVVYFAVLLGPAISLLWHTRPLKTGRRPGRGVIVGYIIGSVAVMVTNDVETNPQFLIIFGFTIGYFKSIYFRKQDF